MLLGFAVRLAVHGGGLLQALFQQGQLLPLGLDLAVEDVLLGGHPLFGVGLVLEGGGHGLLLGAHGLQRLVDVV